MDVDDETRRPAWSRPTGRLRRLVRRVAAWVRRLARWAGRRAAEAADALDEWGARRHRRAFGRRRLLLSWHRDADGSWRARLSGPGVLHTIERTAPTRRQAAVRSARALHRLPVIRARLGRRPPGGPADGHGDGR